MKMSHLKWIAGSILVIALLIWLSTAFAGMTYSEGDRTGTITKFSRKGTPVVGFKTWEGELSMGGLDQGGMPNIWEFSVEDTAIVEKVRQAERHGGRHTLTYRQLVMKMPWKGKTDYFITNVEPTER